MFSATLHKLNTHRLFKSIENLCVHIYTKVLRKLNLVQNSLPMRHSFYENLLFDGNEF